MEVFTARLESFTKPRRVKHSTTKRTLSLKWPHPSHFIATPDTLTEAGFFFNPSLDARDNVECFFCGKCLDGWDEQDDPIAIHWDKCKDRCAWAVVRCGIPEDIDRKGNFAFKDPTREPDGNAMKKARLATFKVNDSWPHDRVKGHGAHSTKMAKAGFVFTPQTPGDDTGTCLYCGVSLSGWDEDDNPSEEHQKRVKKSNLPCPFFPEASAPKPKAKAPTARSTTRPKSRAGSKQPQHVPSDTSSSHSDDDSQPEPAPRRQPKRSRTTSMMSAAKEKDASDALRRSTRSSRAKPPAEVEDNSSGTELRRSTSARGRSKSLAKAKGKEPIEVIEEADEDDAPRVALPKKQRVKGKENVAQDAKVQKPSRKTRTLRANDTDEESRQPKRKHPKKAMAVVDEKDESTSGSDSEKDVQTAMKRRNIVRSASSVEETDEEIKKTAPKPAKSKRQTPIAEDESMSDQLYDTEGLSRLENKAAPSKPRHKPRAKPEAMEDSDEGSDEEPEKQAEQTADSPRPFKLSNGKSATSSGALKADFSQSSDKESTMTPLPAPTEKPARVAKGKGSTSANATGLHHERSRSRTRSGSSSKPFPSTKPVPGSSQDFQTDVMDVDYHVASTPGEPSQEIRDAKTADVLTSLIDGDAHVHDMDMASPTPPTRPARSPERPRPKSLPREESPATPPPASSSLLSVSSTTSMSRAESHTDAETLVEPLPLQVNGARLTETERLTEEEGLMTVEEWIREEIEVHYERLRRDGEMKIKLFKERAEEVRRQIESL